MTEYDLLYKIILVGDASSGKSSFLLQYTHEDYNKNFLTTIGFEFGSKVLQMEDGKKVKLHIWDTVGQENFKSILKSYYKGSNGVILMYSINEKESFNHLTTWVEEINKQYIENKRPPIFLVGNKMEEKERMVTEVEGEAFAIKYGLMFSECNTKTGENINYIFDKLVKTIKGEYIQENINKNQNKILMKYISF